MGLGRVDRYELLALLGQGSFGAVYRAVHVHTGQTHALKLARDTVDADATARALAEARAAASLKHPNVIGVVDGGMTPTGEAFVVMELLEGTTLAEALARGVPFSPMRAVRIARQMLDGLGAAHAANIVHRDVKPSNVFLTEVRDGNVTNEVVKVIDFGISKVRSAGPESVGMTMPGVAIGTPGYMAPEQLGDSRSVDPRADIYSVGVVLFEMLTKRRPIEPDGLATWMHRLMNERAPSLASVAPHLPPALCAVVDRALARDVAGRWPSAMAMRSALEAAFSDAPGEAVQPTAVDTPRGMVAPTSPSQGGGPPAAAATWPQPGATPAPYSPAPYSPGAVVSYPPAQGVSYPPPHALSHPPPHALAHAPVHSLSHAPPPSQKSGSGAALYLIFGALVVLIGLLGVGGVGLFLYLSSRDASDASLASAPAATTAPGAPANAPPVITPAVGGAGAPAPAIAPQAKPGARPAAAPAAQGPAAPGATPTAPITPTTPTAPGAAPPAAPAPAPEAPARAAGGPKISAPKIVGALRQDAFFALAGRARPGIDQCNGDRAAISVRVDIMIANNKITIAQPSVVTNPGDPTIARCAAQAFKDAQFAGFAPGDSGIYQAAEISWK